MIQPKQTIYLFFAGLVTLILIFVPIANLIIVEKIPETMETIIHYYKFSAFSLTQTSPEELYIMSTIGVAIMLAITSILSFWTIFLYKNRKRQMQIISINMFVILLAIFTMMYIYPSFIFPKNAIIADAKLEYNYVILISFVSAIGLFMAKKAIAKDEAIIRKAERLR